MQNLSVYDHTYREELSLCVYDHTLNSRARIDDALSSTLACMCVGNGDARMLDLAFQVLFLFSY